jgi:hypothetical protein
LTVDNQIGGFNGFASGALLSPQPHSRWHLFEPTHYKTNSGCAPDTLKDESSRLAHLTVIFPHNIPTATAIFFMLFYFHFNLIALLSLFVDSEIEVCEKRQVTDSKKKFSFTSTKLFIPQFVYSEIKICERPVNSPPN